MLVVFCGILCIINVFRMIIYLAVLVVRNFKGVENRNDILMLVGVKKLIRVDGGSFLLFLFLGLCYILISSK